MAIKALLISFTILSGVSAQGRSNGWTHNHPIGDFLVNVRGEIVIFEYLPKVVQLAVEDADGPQFGQIFVEDGMLLFESVSGSQIILAFVDPRLRTYTAVIDEESLEGYALDFSVSDPLFRINRAKGGYVLSFRKRIAQIEIDQRLARSAERGFRTPILPWIAPNVSFDYEAFLRERSGLTYPVFFDPNPLMPMGREWEPGHVFVEDDSGIIPGSIITENFSFYFVAQEDPTQRLRISYLHGGSNTRLGNKGGKPYYGLQAASPPLPMKFRSRRNPETGTPELSIRIPGSWRNFAVRNEAEKESPGLDPVRGRVLSDKTYLLDPSHNTHSRNLVLPNADIYTKIVFGSFYPVEERLPFRLYSQSGLVLAGDLDVKNLQYFTYRRQLPRSFPYLQKPWEESFFIDEVQPSSDKPSNLRMNVEWSRGRGRSTQNFYYYFRCSEVVRAAP